MRVGVLGAGAVGAYVGCLIHARCPDAEVVLVGRRAPRRAIGERRRPRDRRSHPRVVISRDHLRVTRDVAALAGRDVVLVAVKSTATADAAAQLARCSPPPDVVILSLQNGVGNAPIIADALARDHPSATILPCVVNMNVVWEGYADEDARVMTLRRCTPRSGRCVVCPVRRRRPQRARHRRRTTTNTRRRGARHRRDASREGAMRVALDSKVREALHSKLLVNLLSPINALAREIVPKTAGRNAAVAAVLARADPRGAGRVRRRRDSNARAVRADSAVSAELAGPGVRAAGTRAVPARSGCKSSMLQDVESGRPTEIETLGAEVRLAAANATRGGRGRGTVAPRNAAVAALVRKVERGEIPDGRVPPEEVLNVIERAAAEANEPNETNARVW